MNQPIDMRSDTVTRPTPAMRKAMANAVVGDDVMQADPTVIELEERIAAKFGKQSALFVPSGTMANLLAIMSQTSPGDEILTNIQSHIYYYECGGYAAVAGCSLCFVDDSNATKPGFLTSSSVRNAVRPRDIHFPTPTFLTLENTHNRGGGVVWPIDQLNEVTDQAHHLGLRVHTDGARIWNAASALDVSLSTLAEGSDTISACLSKGLGCPVGSLLVGDEQTIEIARYKRKMLGGGMRQSGILAAAGLHALDHHLDRLQDDHKNAQRFAQEISTCHFFDFDPSKVETNLVYAKLSSAAIENVGDAFVWQEKFKAAGVLCYAESTDTMRFVTHLDLNESMMNEASKRIRSIEKQMGCFTPKTTKPRQKRGF